MRSTSFFLAMTITALFFPSGCARIRLANARQPEPRMGKYTIIDAHNHDASGNRYKKTVAIWDAYGVEKVVLFGDISEPSAVRADRKAYSAYEKYPDRIIPFIAGINIHDKSCLDYIKDRFDAGVCGIGEIVAASEYSPVASKLPWKGKNCLDGFLPRIYELCGTYGKPILLHIDPPDDYQISILMRAATDYKETRFIFAHANAYTSPEAIERILKGTTNIYIDFFAGFTAYNPDSQFTLRDYVPLIEAYPDRFIVSTDSGYGIGYDKAYVAIIDLLDLLKEETAIKVANKNCMHILGSK